MFPAFAAMDGVCSKTMCKGFVRSLTLPALAASCAATASIPGLVSAQPTEGTTTFVELRAFPIPKGLDLAGVVGSTDGRIAAWTDEDVFVVTDDGRLDRLAGIFRRPLAVGAVGPGWEVVDVGQNTIARFNLTHGEPVITPLLLPGRAYAAARMSCAWVFQLWDPLAGKGSLVLAGESGNVIKSWDIPWAKKDGRSLGQILQLVGAGDQVTATALGYPFATALVHCSGTVEMFDPGPALPRSGNWIALGTVQIPGGYVTTYSDITSDRRVLRRWDSRRRFMKDISLDVPFAFAAPLHAESVLAVRRTDRVEIVVYAVKAVPES